MTAAHRPGWLGADGPAARPPRTSMGRTIAVVTVGFAVFVGASMAVGMMIWKDSPASTATHGGRALGAVSPSVAADTVPTGQLDPITRTATIGPATLVLPDDPYELNPDPMPLDGVFDLFFWAGATVHPNYDGRHSWSSAVLLGRVSDSPGHDDLEAQGRLTMERLSRTFFGNHPTRLGEMTWSDQSVDGHPGMVFSARVHYSVPHLASRYDTVTALLVQLDDGSFVVAAAAVPNDTEGTVARQAAESLSTLSIS
jgi:hypothetical protein